MRAFFVLLCHVSCSKPLFLLTNLTFYLPRIVLAMHHRVSNPPHLIQSTVRTFERLHSICREIVPSGRVSVKLGGLIDPGSILSNYRLGRSPEMFLREVYQSLESCLRRQLRDVPSLPPQQHIFNDPGQFAGPIERRSAYLRSISRVLEGILSSHLQISLELLEFPFGSKSGIKVDLGAGTKFIQDLRSLQQRIQMDLELFDMTAQKIRKLLG